MTGAETADRVRVQGRERDPEAGDGRPFAGIRVLDLTHVLAGPFATYQLAVLGADVIKIEPVDEPDCVRGRGPDDRQNRAGLGLTYQTQASNKRALALDLKDARGRQVLLRLVEGADVLVENYRTGALDALGLGPEVLAERNPDLIHCSMTGYGQTGERAAVNAYDNVIQAASGVMVRTGTAAAPVKTGASFVDYASGLNAAFAIASALFQRQWTGLGQRIDCAMLETALMMMAPEMAAELYLDGRPAPQPASKRGEPGLGCYQTADGHLMLGAFNTRQHRRFWTDLGRPDFAALDTWEKRWAAADAMRAALIPLMRTRTAAAWEAHLHGFGVPAERVRTLGEAARFPHLEERPFLHTLPPGDADAGPVTVPVAAFGYAQGGPAIDRPPPRHGEHSAEILAEIGYGEAEIEVLRAEGVIACS